ncbi:hypothetical protein LPJ63_002437 [Coemansia sp. RSA 2711]|nr:hypothetical protein LPJ63_002437 [Coemansia sp. RSA 2711]KAJ2315649.1 hypothetical protein IWW54_000150 [Coemansia sp. RSA 2705]
MRYLLFLRLLGAALAALLFPAAASPGTGELTKRLAFDIGVSTPAFLIRIPFQVSSGVDSVSGFISIYYQASRSVKVIANAGQRYKASISMTTFMFFMDYSAVLGGGAFVHQAQDTIYLCRIQADIMSFEASQFIAIA